MGKRTRGVDEKNFYKKKVRYDDFAWKEIEVGERLRDGAERTIYFGVKEEGQGSNGCVDERETEIV